MSGGRAGNSPTTSTVPAMSSSDNNEMTMQEQPVPSESFMGPKIIAPKPSALAKPVPSSQGAQTIAPLQRNGGWDQSPTGGYPSMSPMSPNGGQQNNPSMPYMMKMPSVGPSAHDGSDKKRPRTFISKDQAELMAEEFEKNPIPNKELRRKLAERLNLTGRVIQVWFQNRRAKLKRNPGSDSDMSPRNGSPPKNYITSSPIRKRGIKGSKSESAYNDASSPKLSNRGIRNPYMEALSDSSRLRSFSTGTMRVPSMPPISRVRGQSAGSELKSTLTSGNRASMSTSNLSLDADPDSDTKLFMYASTNSEPDVSVPSLFDIAQAAEAGTKVLGMNAKSVRPRGTPEVESDMSDMAFARRNSKIMLGDRPRSRSYDTLSDMKVLIDRGDRPLSRAYFEMDDTQIDTMLQGANGCPVLTIDPSDISTKLLSPMEESLQALIDGTRRISMDVEKFNGLDDLNLFTTGDNFLRI